MPNLPKFTLTKNDAKDRWELKQDKTDRVVKTFETKADATKGGVLQKAVGGEGSVKIEKENGRYQEEFEILNSTSSRLRVVAWSSRCQDRSFRLAERLRTLYSAGYSGSPSR